MHASNNVHRKVVTRFAPSPTGYLHVGGARTALFNWVFARQHGGTFILRMEDTDAARSTARSTQCIIEDLQWLGLNWDEGPDPAATDVYDLASQRGGHGPYFQSQRGKLYNDYLQRLLELGRAYKCFKTPEELTRERDKAKAEKRPYKYDPTDSLNLSKDQIAKYEAQGLPYVVRFRMPEAAVTVHDLVLGDVTIQREELEDFVIAKGDGGPTFHFANVVDDAEMKVTHVLRAQEHLMNTPKHVAMFDALGIERPQYAHMPLIFNADGSKMSKRDKAKVARLAATKWQQSGNAIHDLIIELAKESSLRSNLVDPPARAYSENEIEDFFNKKNDEVQIAELIAKELKTPLPEIDVHDFRASGYLPDVLLNYLALLGWSPGNDVERFDLDYMVKNFAIDRIGKSNARFDRAKLLAFNAEAINKLTPDDFREKLREHLQTADSLFYSHVGFYHHLLADETKFALFAEAYRPRSRTFDEPAVNGRFFALPDELIRYDQNTLEKVMVKSNGGAALRELRPVLDALATWDAPSIHAAIEQFAKATGRGMGDVAQPLRVAVSGSTTSPPIDVTLVILGKPSTLARIDHCLNHAGVATA